MPLQKHLLIFSVEHFSTFVKAKALMEIKGEKREAGEQPSENVIGSIVAVYTNVDDSSVLRDTPDPGAIHVGLAHKEISRSCQKLFVCTARTCALLLLASSEPGCRFLTK